MQRALPGSTPVQVTRINPQGRISHSRSKYKEFPRRKEGNSVILEQVEWQNTKWNGQLRTFRNFQADKSKN